MKQVFTLWWRLGRAGKNNFSAYTIEHPSRGFAVLLVLVAVWALIAGLSLGALAFLNNPKYVDLKEALLRQALSLFFFSLFFLVVISNCLLIWNALFKSEGARFQAQLPIPNRQLFWGATSEGGLWGSWAVIALGLPLLLSLGIESKELITFIPSSIITLAAFVACCIGAASLSAMLFARFLPLFQKHTRLLTALGFITLAAVIYYVQNSEVRQQNPGQFLQTVFANIAFVQNPLLPPRWAQEATSAALRQDWNNWFFYTALLASCAICLGIVGELRAHLRLRADLDALNGRGDKSRRSFSRRWRLSPFLPQAIALQVAKDIRLFVRDPAQILQFVMFFGMLTFYIIMLPQFGKHFMDDAWWRRAVSLLNMVAVAMALGTFTSRFVYPLLSLEGKRRWILILAPWSLTSIVTAKLCFALVIGLPISVTLVSISGIVLSLPTNMIIYQALVTMCLGLGLAAAALGLGAALADYHEDNPAKLVSGYGGTINLLSSLLFTGLMVMGATIPLFWSHKTWAMPLGLLWTLGFSTIWTQLFLNLAKQSFIKRH